jgi:tripartite-type tricarboxylate transporter receptor subunit TctC
MSHHHASRPTTLLRGRQIVVVLALLVVAVACADDGADDAADVGTDAAAGAETDAAAGDGTDAAAGDGTEEAADAATEPDADAGTEDGGTDQEAVTFDRPVDMIVPFGPGGGADSVARTAAAVMEGEIGVALPVINIPGATGSTGLTRLTSSPPGSAAAILIQDTLSTVAFGSASFGLDEVTGVCRLQEMPSALFVQSSGPYESAEDLIEAARQAPGEITVATVGQGGIDDVVLAAIGESEGVQFQPVPFPNPAERYAALLGGAVDAMYEQLGDVRTNIDSGEFRTIMLFSEGPVEGLEGGEGLPLGEEFGVDFVLPQFRGIVVSADTEPAVVQTLSDACVAAADAPEFQEFQETVFASPESFQDAETFTSFLQEQETVIADLMRQYGMIQE